MSDLTIQGANAGTALRKLLMCDEIEPGAEPGYEMCKLLYLYHPLAAKMAESPIRMAQSQQRDIVIPDSPEERVKEQFLRQWKADSADKYIFQTYTLSRVYGISSAVLLVEGTKPDAPVDYTKLSGATISFNIMDPLNTAGSLVMQQDPNSASFLKTTNVSVQGVAYHRSRCVVVMNEGPIYLGYTSSAFGFVGRSVYQRALFPMKSFINTMIADDMVARKVGLLVATLISAGSIVDNMMAKFAGIKRALLKEAANGQVISIGKDEKIESLNLQNLEGPLTAARKNILENIAVAADMPAKLLNSETFAEGFGEGTEDAKHVARYIDRLREEMNPLYDWFDKIVQYRAWNENFYKTIQKDFEEYRGVTYTEAFYRWTNSFKATWPSLLTEPDSEKVKVDEVRLKGVISLLEVILPIADPQNKAIAVQWACDNFNEMKLMFSDPINLDAEALAAFTPAMGGEGEPGGDVHTPLDLATGVHKSGADGAAGKGHEAEGDSPAAAQAGSPSDETIAEISLNGAQVTSMVDIVGKVATGELPMESALAIMTTAFPIDEAQARKLFTGVVPGSQKEVEEPAAPAAKGDTKADSEPVAIVANPEHDFGWRPPRGGLVKKRRR